MRLVGCRLESKNGVNRETRMSYSPVCKDRLDVGGIINAEVFVGFGVSARPDVSAFMKQRRFLGGRELRHTPAPLPGSCAIK